MTSIDDPNFKIFSWNARSIYNKLSEFKDKLIEDKPHIVCLNETWLKPDREPSFQNYTAFYDHRTDGNGGGLAFLVRNDLHCLKKTLLPFANGFLEVQAMTVYSGNRSFDFLKLYNPNKNVSVEEFLYFFRKLSSNFFI